MLSSSDTPVIRCMYRRFEIVEHKARRAINRDGVGRRAVTELRIMSNW